MGGYHDAYPLSLFSQKLVSCRLTWNGNGRTLSAGRSERHFNQTGTLALRWLASRLSTPAGFELGSGMSINTVLPEDAAAFLREVPVACETP
jgi:hypothetical protein